MSQPVIGTRNLLLRSLPGADMEVLLPLLKKVSLRTGDVCVEPNAPIESLYFLESGLGSSVFPDEQRGTTELGMQGYEGLIGLPILLGADRGPQKVFMQVGGTAQRISAEAIAALMDRSATLRRLLLRYVQVFLLQSAQTAYANARFSIHERLARWILMAADRLGPKVALTHEYLAYMLGARRASVTEGLHVLEGKHLIRNTRGLIVLRDRDGMEALAGLSYGIPEAEYRQLIGPLPSVRGTDN
jgi:CRP-like cAMP-binding protein